MDDMEAFEPLFRAHFNTTYSRGGASFEDYAPAYRYGYSLANDDRFATQEWYEVEPLARDEWMREHTDREWDDVREAIHRGWKSLRE